MDYQLYGNADILLNDNSSNSDNSWNLPSDCSMDNNDEYFGWNSLKINEEKLEEDAKIIRKRKLSTNGDDSKMKENYKLTKDPLSIVDKSPPIKKMIKGTTRMPPWQEEDYGQLNTDIDSSLSLGPEIANNSYNVHVSDPMLSINTMTVFKQEVPSPTSNEMTQLHIARQHRQSPTSTQGPIVNAVNSTMEDNTSQSMINNTINQLLSQTTLVNLHNVIENNNLSPSNSQDNYAVSSTNYSLIEDSRFQYVLAAATSIATKQNEDTLTYLNQGQSYEIKLKKLGDLSMYRGKMLKPIFLQSIIRICFHERRLQYMEKEQMISWQKSRPGDRILEVDVPLSYGAFEIIQPSSTLNVIHFAWDPTKEVGVYIKVNCISTEFTPKKHGGEKGVPFRIQVETYQSGDTLEAPKRLHAAACQIKVFKLKGADRKHKQDRDKIMKRPLSEQEKYQPSYECTVLNDIRNDAVLNTPPVVSTSTVQTPESSPHFQNTQVVIPRIENDGQTQNNTIVPQQVPLPTCIPEKRENTITNDSNQYQLLQDASPHDTIEWLALNRFDKYVDTFSRFSGADMLRMSREDIIQICGHADGIRLHNALHFKTIAPKLKIYVCREKSSVFNAIFLSAHSNVELLQKLSLMMGVSQDQVRDVYMEGPHSIHVQLNNDVLKHIKEETMFSLEVMQDNDRYIFLLKRTNK